MQLPVVKEPRGDGYGQTELEMMRQHRSSNQMTAPWHYRLPASLLVVFVRLRRIWLSLFSLLFPLLLFCFLDSQDRRFRCLYVVCVMISSWLTAANDPVLVAIYPVILCPLLGVAGIKSLAESYFRPISFLMFGTSLVAAAFSRTGLDVTISTFILNHCSLNPPLLCLGLMLSSAALSMWISNASTVVILSPIAIHVLGGWAARFGEDADLHQMLRVGCNTIPAGRPRRNNSVGQPTGQSPLAGLEYVASTSADAVLSTMPSKEATVACIEKSHEKTSIPKTEAPANSTRDRRRRTDCRDGDAHLNSTRDQKQSTGYLIEMGTGVIVDEVTTTSALPSMSNSVEKIPSVVGEHNISTSAARAYLDAGTVSGLSPPRYVHSTSSAPFTHGNEEKNAQLLRRLKNAVLLGLAYSATLGGMSTLNGSFVNPTLVHVLESSYDFESSASQQNPINFTSWMAFACPLGLLCVFLAWLALSSLWLGVSTTAHAILRLVVYPVNVMLSAVRLPLKSSRRVMRRDLPRDASLSAASAAHEAASMQSAADDPTDMTRKRIFCTDSTDVEGHDRPALRESSALLHTTDSDAAGQTERSRSFAAQTVDLTAGSTYQEPPAVMPGDKSHPFAQVEVLLLLAALISLWLTRSLGSKGKNGWGKYFTPYFVDDSVPVLLLGMFPFFLPLEPPSLTWKCLCCWMKTPGDGDKKDTHNERAATQLEEGGRRRRSRRAFKGNKIGAGHPRPSPLAYEGGREENQQSRPRPAGWFEQFRKECKRTSTQRKEYTPILTYSYAAKHIEWGALLLLGGGFAMATSMKRTGLDLWIGNAVLRFAMVDKPALIISVLLLASFLTEVTSNTATANVLLPILNGVARQATRSPLLVLIPATVGAQFAFMLPLGTASNAVVLKKGKLRPLDMFWSGLVVKISVLSASLVAMVTWGDWLFDLNTRPAWAG